MGWIDYEKAYDIVPQNWILKSQKMYKIFPKIIKL